MDNFKFRLQKLLDIRKDREEESKRIFKEAQMEREKSEAKLNSLKEEYNKYKVSPPKTTIVEQKIKNIYLNSLRISIKEADLELKNKINNLEEKRKLLKQRQIERKTVETLKDKQREAFIKEQNLIEQKMNDEFALYGFLRNKERG